MKNKYSDKELQLINKPFEKTEGKGHEKEKRKAENTEAKLMDHHTTGKTKLPCNHTGTQVGGNETADSKVSEKKIAEENMKEIEEAKKRIECFGTLRIEAELKSELSEKKTIRKVGYTKVLSLLN